MRLVGRSSGITKVTTIGDRITHHFMGAKDFVAIDGEGINLPNGDHIYGLVGINDDQILNKDGLVWNRIFQHLYDHFEPGIAYVGYYLSYDFNRWICTMPYERAHRLITKEGVAKRRSKSTNLHSRVLPVDLPFGWQVDMLGNKMLKFRKRECNCDWDCCGHSKDKWMHICDAGPFFQSSFLKAIDPKEWAKPIVSTDEYELIKAGKEKRAYADEFDDEMIYYNALENEILVRLMKELDIGFRKMGIALPPSSWYGPGQVAQQWMKKEKVTNKKTIQETVPEWMMESARASYFGGWFEIMMHGTIPGKVYQYDINSAYPHIIKSLPCLLHGKYERGKGRPTKDTGYVLVYATVSGSKKPIPNVIGAMLHRRPNGRILRPVATRGWYWLGEIKAAQRAGLIANIHYYEWMSYDPCDCLPPMRNVSNLYDLRLQVKKNSPLGKGAKLAYNSMYGKLAQSIGNPIFANPIWASLITSGCRSIILDAIATHPNGQYDVCMVATDAVFFVSPHPSLAQSKKLGEWDFDCHDNLTLFKPGFYWDDATRNDIAEKRNPVFKARGISGADFADSVSQVDRLFAEWDSVEPGISDHDGDIDGWPYIKFQTGFTMISCLQAIRWGNWELAGKVLSNYESVQNGNPVEKRLGVWRMPLEDGRMVWRSVPWNLGKDGEIISSTPYAKRFGMEDPWSDEFQGREMLTRDGTVPEVIHDTIME